MALLPVDARPLPADLTSDAGLLEYLSQTPYACSGITRLSGGISSFTYRGQLIHPVTESEKTVIIKHTEPYVATNRAFVLDVIRSVRHTVQSRPPRRYRKLNLTFHSILNRRPLQDLAAYLQRNMGAYWSQPQRCINSIKTPAHKSSRTFTTQRTSRATCLHILSPLLRLAFSVPA